MFVLLIQVLWSGAAAVFMVLGWRDSIGESDVSYRCPDGGTCYRGPTTYLVLALVFGGICLVFLTLVVVFAARWRVARARREQLIATGVRVPALLVRIDPTGTHVNGRNVRRNVFEARPGGRVIQAVERSMALLPLGTRATIAYDPADRTRAVVVENVDTLEEAASREAAQAHQAFVDGMFPTDRPFT